MGKHRGTSPIKKRCSRGGIGVVGVLGIRVLFNPRALSGGITKVVKLTLTKVAKLT
jgi:hypothetical protein